jgi:hypothetical protein
MSMTKRPYCAVCGSALDQRGRHFDDLAQDDHEPEPTLISWVESLAIRRAFVVKQRGWR